MFYAFDAVGFDRLSQFAKGSASLFRDLVRTGLRGLTASERLHSQFRVEDVQFVSQFGVERNPLRPSRLFRFVFDRVPLNARSNGNCEYGSVMQAI